MLDTDGVAPKGQPDRHWQRPTAEEAAKSSPQRPDAPDPYAHLRVVGE
jgi:hypothetical protein